jgi:hypothetical protein
VSPGGHSAKYILKILKKILCRVPDHGHSAKTIYLPTVSPFFLTLSLSLTLSPRCRPVAVCAPRRLAVPLAVRLRRRRPSPHRRTPPRPSPLDAPPSATPSPPAMPSLARRRALHAAASRRLARDPAPCRLARDPPSRPRPHLEGDLYETIRLILSHIYIRVLVRLICKRRLEGGG